MSCLPAVCQLQPHLRQFPASSYITASRDFPSLYCVSPSAPAHSELSVTRHTKYTSINKFKKSKVLYVTYLPRSPPWTDLHQIWCRASSPEHNHLCQILCRSVQGFRFCRRSKFPLLHWLSWLSLTQWSRYCSACDKNVPCCLNGIKGTPTTSETKETDLQWTHH